MWLALFVWAGVRNPHYLEVDLACKGVIGWTIVFQAITIIIDLILALIILLT